VTTTRDVQEDGTGEVRLGPVWNAAGWFLGISGGISLFLGLFVMFGNESSSIGIGGDVSWEVGEVGDAVMYALLIGGGVALLLALGIILWGPRREVTPTPGLSELIWHTGVFLVVNTFIWVQDIAVGGGVDYAYWVTIPWGIGLAIHALTYAREHPRNESRPLGEPQPH
jgi:hypothetical protein